MSKKSQREAREKKERSEQEKLLKFSTTLKGYLSTFAQLYRQEVSDEAVGAYQIALQHLTPEQLKIACDEAIKQCKFFPNPAEILHALKDFYDRSPYHRTRDETEEQQFNAYFEKLSKRGREYCQQVNKEEQAVLTRREPGDD